MATRIIDEFSVKPSGFLASWRYVRVLIDENGNLSTQAVPGKPFPNLPCISDYNRVNRRYANGTQIAEFCNFETFTNYRVYAQNCTPYAFVQADLNATQCGYNETPLPEPAVPPNPFGNATYGLYYFFDYCDIDGEPINVKIFKKSYAGVAIQVEEGGKTPIVLRRSSADPDNKFSEIRSTECVITFNSLIDFEFQRFYTDDEREYRVEVIKSGQLQFAGYVIPDTAMEPFVAPPYPVTLRAVDGLGALKNVTYPIPVGSSIDIRQSFLDIICFCLAMTNLPLDIRTVCNLYESKMLNGIDDDPLAQASVNPLRMADSKGNIINCYEALTEVLKLFGAYIVQQNGQWQIIRINELQSNSGIIRSRVYNYTGLFLYSENLAPLRVAGKDQEIELINKDHQLRIGNAYKRVEGILKFGDTPALLFNGGFEQWDGQNFNYWTKFGGINITQVQKQIRGTGGQMIDIQDFACQFNERADSGKWLQANPVVVTKGDKLALSLDIKKHPRTNSFRLRVNIEDWYLFKPIESKDPVWVQALATSNLFLEHETIFNVNSYVNYTLNIPECPISGTIMFSLFGFSEFFYYDSAGKPVEGTTNYPAQIDNIGISINNPNGNDKNVPDGLLLLSEQLGFYTNSPEPIEFVFGDYTPLFTLVDSSLSQNIQEGIKNGVIQQLNIGMYAIYTADGGYSQSWYEYGQSSNQLPICLTTVKAILKAYQQPLRYMDGSFKGEALSYTDLIRFEVPNNTPFSNRVFAVMSGDFDLKYNEMTNATLVELFSRNINSNDVSLPHSPGDVSPPITQNPNNPSPDTIGGIFTDEFSEQFL